MVYSMTAFSRQSTQQAFGQAVWEIRSVNHRYLDLSLKVPEPFREWESDFRHCISQHVTRGKVECHLQFNPSGETTAALNVNNDLVDQLLHECQLLMKKEGVKENISALKLLKWPGVITLQPADLSTLKNPLLKLLQTAMEELTQSRWREGQQIEAFLREKLDLVNEQLIKVSARLPECLLAQKQKLQQKLHELNANFDTDRLEQEFLYYAQRQDVAEEIARLNGHVKEVRRVLKEKSAMGRRLDFLMQELNREANTLASKSLDEAVTLASVELKVCIEQMREQIQNIE